MLKAAFGVLAVIALAFVAVSFVPLIDTYTWWVRIADFPRLQFALVLVGLAIVILPFIKIFPKASVALLLPIAAAVGLHGFILSPYLPLGGHTTASRCPTGRSLSVMVANVHIKNAPDGKLVGMVRRRHPDLLFTEEVDAGWNKALGALRETMPHSIEKITGGPFSSQLQSRLPLISPEVKHLGSQKTPQIVTGVRLRNGDIVQFLGIHPRPPYPSQSALGRDAVLMKAGLIARSSKQPTVLGGDLNGTPWESAIDRMQRIARFIDPRQGYGYLPTYDAQSWWMAWPLDQIFYQAGFALVSLTRLGNIGSDHYPYVARLCRISKQRGQQPPAPEPQAIAQAKQTIKLAKKRDAGGHRGKN